MSSSSIKQASQDEMRMKHYRAQIDRQNEVDLQDIEQKHKQHLVNLMQTHEQKTADLQRDYEIQISKEGEALEEGLHQTRLQNSVRIQEEQKAADLEFARLKSAHNQRLEDFKKDSDAQLEALHKQLQASAQVMHEQDRKAKRKLMELSQK